MIRWVFWLLLSSSALFFFAAVAGGVSAATSLWVVGANAVGGVAMVAAAFYVRFLLREIEKIGGRS